MITAQEFKELKDKYPEAKEVLRMYFDDWENEKGFRKLISIKHAIPEKFYGAILRVMALNDTDEVQDETLKEAYKGISREALMEVEELNALNEMPNDITIYRGTQDSSELVPRLSWSLDENRALRFASAHLFKAVISKDKVLAYYLAGGEEEIVTIVTDNYQIIF